MYWRSSWGKCETLLKRPCRMQDRIFVQIESLEIEWYLRICVCVHRKGWLSSVIERVISQPRISICVIWYHDAIGRIYLGRELCRALSRLFSKSISF